MGTQIRGEFIGFSFGGVHSSTLGLIRTSDGSRYNENLLPTIQDKTVQVPGGDGMYYFGSYYTQREFNISIAYDSVTENQLRLIKHIFSTRKLQKLIFDEYPDRYYMAKCSRTPNLKYICFGGENANERIYKGEGTLTFICYEPFAYSEQKILDLNLVNGTHQSLILNQGDFESDWSVLISGVEGGGSSSKPLSFRLASETAEIVGKNLIFKGLDNKIIINSKSNLFQGAIENNGIIQPTINIYNDFFSGQFFKIKNSQERNNQKFIFTSQNSNTKIEKLIYNYKFI